MTRWCFLFLLGVLLPWGARAGTVVDLGDPPSQELGESAIVLSESGVAWSPEQALAALQRDGEPGRRKVLNLGIGRPALWMTLALDNAGDAPVTRQILLGQAWLDHVDVWILGPQGVERHWRTGDEVAGQPGLDDVHGYVFEHDFAPGASRLLVRVRTVDQLTVNLRLRTPEAAAAEGDRDRYLYGFLYGFIFSLVAYNLMLYVGLRRPMYVLYALYLSAFLLLNMAYTGRATLWFWGDWVVVQRFSIVTLIILMPSQEISREYLQNATRAGVHDMIVKPLATNSVRARISSSFRPLIRSFKLRISYSL